MNQSLFFLKLFSALGCGLIAGVFFAFSTFVMSALARLQPAQGIAAMQSINIVVINPWFMTVFLGTAVSCSFLVFSSLSVGNQSTTIYVIGGCLLYLVGTFLVTMVCNVPLNEALAKVDPESVDGANLWASYLVSWTFWNHVRTAAAIAASATLTMALCTQTNSV
ncbi:MAG: anthrone oxygenase family protein [Thermosynechococcaceae cyanobacterium]